MNKSRGQLPNGFTTWLNSLSLRARLTLFFLVISLIPLVGITIKDVTQTRQALINAAEISLKAGAEQTANSLDNFIDNTLADIRVESQFEDIVAYLSLFPSKRPGSIEEQRASDLLKKLTGKDTVNIVSYALVDLTGNVLLDTVQENIGTNEFTNEYFLNIIGNKLPTVTAVTYSGDTTTIIHFASFVRDSGGNPVGILRVEYNSSVLQQTIIRSLGSSTSRITLLDELNIRIADNQHPELIQKSIVPLTPLNFVFAVNGNRLKPTTAEDQSSNLQDFELGIKNAQQQPFFNADLDSTQAGDDSIAGAYMKTRPWVVAYSQPTSLFLADVQQQTGTNVFLTIIIALGIAILATLISRLFTTPILHLTETAEFISQGNLNTRAVVEGSDEIGLLASTFNSMTEQLQVNLTGLEQRVAERTLTLERRSAELSIVAEVARDINTIRNVDTLLNLTVDMIRERFNSYHAAIYLADDRGEYLNLRAASGNTGQTMIENRYKLKLNGPGIIAFVSRTGESHLAEDSEKDPTYIMNPLLPNTRSEITLPLRSGNTILGALDIQSTVPNAFSSENTPTMQLLADQIVVALENAQLLQRLESTLQELNTARQAQTQISWRKATRDRNHNAMEYDGTQTKPIRQSIPDDVLMQLQNGKPLLLDDTNGHTYKNNTLLIPLIVLDRVVGVIGLEQDDPEHEWTNEDINLAQSAAVRAALSLENARLLEESQKRANKEQSISIAANKIGSMQQIENILYATAEELEKTLGSSEIIIQFENKE